jgi:hypothetical protein
MLRISESENEGDAPSVTDSQIITPLEDTFKTSTKGNEQVRILIVLSPSC